MCKYLIQKYKLFNTNGSKMYTNFFSQLGLIYVTFYSDSCTKST